jgi:hypothetical protein
MLSLMALSYSQVSHEGTGFYEIGKVQFLSRFLHLGLYLNLTGADFSAVKKTKKRVCAASPHILIIRTLSAERAGAIRRPLSH